MELVFLFCSFFLNSNVDAVGEKMKINQNKNLDFIIKKKKIRGQQSKI